jgi:cell wall-associated NlpC family hydrolase
MVMEMHSLADAGRRLRRRLKGRGPKARKRLIPVLVSVLVVLGAVVGVALAAAGSKPAKPSGRNAALPSSSPAPARTGSNGPVVPLLGENTEGRGKPMAVPVASAAASTKSASTKSASTTSASTTSASTTSASTTSARSARVAPLHGLRQADLLVVAPFSLSAPVLAAVSRLPGVTSAEPLEAAKIKINGVYTAVLGVNPSTFRGYAARAMATSSPLWQGVANGGVAVSYTMGTLDRLSLGGTVTAAGRTQQRLPGVAFGTVGIGGVDAVVSDSTARSLGVPAANAIVISATPADVTSLAARIKQILPSGAGVEPLVTLVTGTSAGAAASAGAATSAGAAAAAADGAGMTTTQLTTALRAAESRRGFPYVWGAAGPASFDCSGLVQWSFAQAGVSMPRVAVDQARTGPAVPVSQLEPGDLLFYHTDPTDPGYISHVAIYLGHGWMIQAPQPGLSVQVVPADFSSQFAGAIRVDPRLAAEVAAGLA